MRKSIGVLGGIVALFVGIQALGIAGESAETAVENGSNMTQYSFDMTSGIFESIGTAAPPAIVWGGVAAFVLLSLGLLYVVVGGGGR